MTSWLQCNDTPITIRKITSSNVFIHKTSLLESIEIIKNLKGNDLCRNRLSNENTKLVLYQPLNTSNENSHSFECWFPEIFGSNFFKTENC